MPEDNSQQKPLQAGHWLGHSDNHRKLGERRVATRRELSRERTIADWVGPERATEVIASLRPETPTIADLVDEQLLACRGRAITNLDKLRQNWTKLVGDDCAAQSYPSHLNGNTLVIEVNNSTWKYMMELQKKDEILSFIQTFLADGSVKALRFVLRGTFSR